MSPCGLLAGGSGALWAEQVPAHDAEHQKVRRNRRGRRKNYDRYALQLIPRPGDNCSSTYCTMVRDEPRQPVISIETGLHALPSVRVEASPSMGRARRHRRRPRGCIG